MDSRKLSVGLVSLALITGAGAWAFAQPGQPAGNAQPGDEGPEGDKEEVIAFDKAPESVRAAALKLAGDAKNITKVIREQDDEDAVQYEIEYNEGAGANAIKCAAIFSAAGDLMETEKATMAAGLPEAVMAALNKDYPGATFNDPQAVTRMFYEIEVVRGGKTHEVKVDASGNIEDESGDGDEHGAHAGGEDREKGEKHEDKGGEEHNEGQEEDDND